MSQNKTIIPGQRIHHDEVWESIKTNSRTQEDLSAIYRQSSAPTQGRTMVAGMYDSPVGQAPAPAPEQPKIDDGLTVVLQDRPIAGFLFSVSRKATGEFFPLYLGRNIVGRDADCDVRLPETTVSGHHAVIVVRKVGQSESKEIVSITDTNSSSGTAVNGIQIDFDTHLIENHDHILIGSAFELVLVKLDADELGLKPSPYFEQADGNGADNPYAPSQNVSQQHRTIISQYKK